MNLQELIESLSPIERKIVPYLNDEDIYTLIEKSRLDRISVLKALEFLNTKKVISLKIEKRKKVDLGVNGIHYKKTGLPERQLIYLIETKPYGIGVAQKDSGLSENEFKAAIGALKNKALIELKNGKILFIGKKEELSKKFLEEQFIEKLPLYYDKLNSEQKYALSFLKDRKDIIEIRDEQVVSFEVLPLGKELVKQNLTKFEDLIEELTPELIKSESWKGKKFRRYDITSNVPRIYGGKRHFVNQSIDYGRRVWSEMGFKEMSGNMIQESFWNFDALFTAQDHSVRDLQDTFFLDSLGKLDDKKIVKNIKQSHESGVDGSKGWQYSWNEEEARKLVLRTHTTCLSAQALYTLSKLPKEQRRGKFFAIGKCFRNETIDWSHGFEFNQTEGIVIVPDANFRHLLGYLKEFFMKMGFDRIRFRPHYFPYTEPSVEIDAWHAKKNKWLELGGAGIFRPEVVIPLLGEWVPVLAWGPGFDRILMDYYEIKDLRELYNNDIQQLRNMKFWNK